MTAGQKNIGKIKLQALLKERNINGRVNDLRLDIQHFIHFF
jgi:hypothetical protein